MSWVNDLASSLGIPAGAVTLALAVYAACAAAEKAARPEALKDIGRILNDRTWEQSVRPSAIVDRIFVWTFGERHFSWKCVSRSMIATFVILFCVGVNHVFRCSRKISGVFRKRIPLWKRGT